jgi:hypothetical protein
MMTKVTRRGVTTLALGLLLVGISCAPAPLQLPSNTPDIGGETGEGGTVTLLPTAPTVWFPPTDTLAPLSTRASTPTPETRPGLGPVIFTDDFSDESQWLTAESSQGSAIIIDNRIVLAVREPNVGMLSLRDGPILSDFYAEIVARPRLCTGRDDYGLLYRAGSPNDYYRVALTCDGTVRTDRILSGQASVMILPTRSGDVPPGAPGEVRIGIWASGPEMRVFLNDHYQFTVFDPLFRSGTLGVFARSAGNTAVTITFSDLVVSEVSYASPTATLTPSVTPKPTRTPRPTP